MCGFLEMTYITHPQYLHSEIRNLSTCTLQNFLRPHSKNVTIFISIPNTYLLYFHISKMEWDDSVMQHLIAKYAFSNLTTVPWFDFNSQNNFWQEKILGLGGEREARKQKKRKKKRQICETGSLSKICLFLNFHPLFIKCEHLHYISKYLDENSNKIFWNIWILGKFLKTQLVPNSHWEMAALDSLMD